MAGIFSNPLSPKDWVRGNAVGSGSFGVVNLAMNQSTGELFVVKSTPSGTGFLSLKNEADILRSLDSPYIVRCLGHDVSNEPGCGQRFNLFMEFMAGGSLSEIVDKFGGVLTESVVKSYTTEIVKGISYLHRNEIIHGDLKCKNVLLGSSGNVKLADFGSARRLGSSKANEASKESRQSLCGTPLWMAPEVLRNEGLGFESDIWSLGCTVIEMATGRPPWADDFSNPMAAVYEIACGNDTPRFPYNFSEEGLDFLRKCLQRDPTLRWSCEELLNHPFITENSKGVCLNKKVSFSPTSVLDEGLREGNCSSDESNSSTKEEVSTWIPFSTRCSKCERMKSMRKDIDVQATEEWLLVRSG